MIVLTPLLALLKDQMDRCDEADVHCRSWSSEVDPASKRAIRQDLLSDEPALRILFTTPESLAKEDLREVLGQAHALGHIKAIAVDEAHCAAQWHDFRPSYLGIGPFRSQVCPGVPILALTATAAPHVQASLVQALGLRAPMTSLSGGVNRPNLGYRVEFKELLGDGGPEAVLDHMAAYIRGWAGATGIVYSHTRQQVDEVARGLQERGIDCAAYHAGKDNRARASMLRDWKEGTLQVVVATIAFGLGVDMATVRFVAHYCVPSSLEHFLQESGRAGRDGARSESVVYCGQEDMHRIKRLDRQGVFEGMARYCMAAGCRRRIISEHFQEQRRGGCQAGDEKCDYCLRPGEVVGRLAALDRRAEEAAAREAEELAEKQQRQGMPKRARTVNYGIAPKASAAWGAASSYGTLPAAETGSAQSAEQQQLEEEEGPPVVAPPPPLAQPGPPAGILVRPVLGTARRTNPAARWELRVHTRSVVPCSL